jgi:hypothetical protein
VAALHDCILSIRSKVKYITVQCSTVHDSIPYHTLTPPPSHCSQTALSSYSVCSARYEAQPKHRYQDKGIRQRGSGCADSNGTVDHPCC